MAFRYAEEDSAYCADKLGAVMENHLASMFSDK